MGFKNTLLADEATQKTNQVF